MESFSKGGGGQHDLPQFFHFHQLHPTCQLHWWFLIGNLFMIYGKKSSHKWVLHSPRKPSRERTSHIPYQLGTALVSSMMFRRLGPVKGGIFVSFLVYNSSMHFWFFLGGKTRFLLYLSAFFWGGLLLS